ncbi:hypothetical protein MRX96_042775 [Rhipicephalus microplus]
MAASRDFTLAFENLAVADGPASGPCANAWRRGHRPRRHVPFENTPGAFVYALYAKPAYYELVAVFF